MIEQLNTIGGLWWNWAAAMFWQVGLLIVLIACIDRLTRKWTWPQLRYALWSLVLIKLILPPTLSLPSSVAPRLTPVVTEVWNTAADRRMGNSLAHADPGDGGGQTAWASELPMLPLAADDSRMGLAHRQVAPEEAGVLGTPDVPPASVHAQSAIPNPQLAWQFYAMALWLTGAAVLAAFLVLRLRSLSQADKRASKAPPLPESFYNQVSGCAGRLGLRHLPRVVATDKVTCPAVFGVLRPVLLVPHGYLGRLSRRDTEHMLLHELAHVKRGDLLAHGVYMLLQIVYWYHPLLWLVRRQVHHLRELCCDATVANLLREDTGAYRQTLLETARRFLATRTEPGLGLLGLFEDSNRLLVRLNWLNKPTWRYRRMKRTIVITIVGLMLACVLPMGQAQDAVSRESSPEVVQHDDQSAAEIAALQARLEELTAQQRELRKQLDALRQSQQQSGPSKVEAKTEVAERGWPEPFNAHTVKKGDTLASIAQTFYGRELGSRPENIERIAKANHLDSSDRLWPGQWLRIPVRWMMTDNETAGPSHEQVERIHRQLNAAEQRVHDMSGALVDADHALSEAEHTVAGAQTHGRTTSTSATRSRVPILGDLPMMGRLFVNVPNEDAVLDITLPERVQLIQLLDLLGKHTNLNFIYDPDVVTGEVALKISGPIRVGDLYLLLESALQAKGLAMERHDGDIVAIVPRKESPRTDLLEIAIPESPPAPALTAAAAVDADYVVKALKRGTELRIQNNVGSLKLQGGPGRDCAIKVKIEAKGATPQQAEEIAKQVLIQVTPRDNVVEIGVQFPEEMTKEQRQTVQVHFDMTVPQDIILRAIQNVGDVRVADLHDSTVQVRTNVGAIRTRNLQGKVALSSNTGDIEVILPPDPSIKVNASARVGAIKSDVPLDITSASVIRAGDARGALGSTATGVLGAGADKLDVTSNVGSIKIRSASAAGSPGL